jgi:LemA protein
MRDSSAIAVFPFRVAIGRGCYHPERPNNNIGTEPESSPVTSNSLIYLVLAGGITIWAIVIFNRLVRDKNRVLAAWSDIDVQLKRRHDLIPKLVDAVKQYAAFEKATLEGVTALRTRAKQVQDLGELSKLESAISNDVRRLIAVAEQYPDLKANLGFLDLQQNITDAENHLQMSRRYYNGSVRNFNTRIDSFPDMIIARLFGFRPRDLFEMEDK